uniref:MABP1/WDR62 second WD40 domain-containing protein n=1 Tax=Knipowitschia caucasica TaxID=637954 RepID=A0AAV2K7B8_KNICA
MPRDGVTVRGRIKSLIRKSRQESLSGQANVTLEVVLGVTSIGNNSLALDPSSGLVAYPAGCVVVLWSAENRQQHIINTSQKTFTALSFSPDGKYLVTGESGHLPAVRLWAVSELRQVAELQTHKYGVSCVAFSPNGKYIVSVGNQHDMMVHVWAWKKDSLEAANKVSCKVTGVSFSKDSSYFVTVGDRHVKFWYLDPCESNKCGAPVPLLGRPGLLGEHKNHCFTAVACGRGSHSHCTFCITSSGLLCQLNQRRVLDQWQDLRTPAAHSLCVAEDLLFCGCSDGTVKIFAITDLSFICTLPHPHPHLHPHPLPSDTSAPSQTSPASSFSGGGSPAVVALACDSGCVHLSAVFSDHSVCVWGLQDGVGRVDTLWSAAYHSSCVWDLQMFPDALCQSGLLRDAFLSCSVDNTIRMWRMSRPPHRSTNLLTVDLVHTLQVDKSPVVMVDPESTSSLTTERSAEVLGADSRTGIRSICVRPDGKHLASGDHSGVLRVHELSSMEQILKVGVHHAEILCLQYSRPETGLRLLATAGRDRLIHLLDSDYSLLQTLDDHSSSITALIFTVHGGRVRLISCGTDKSIYFHTAHRREGTVQFFRSHHMVTRSTLCDISVDPSGRLMAVAGQDHCLRLFDVSTGKQKKVYKSSLSGDGSLLKVQMDPSGLYVATSCSDKTISLLDLHTGECVATMSGHSEVVTALKFTNDCMHLISASGDSCVFVWRLKPELTLRMRRRQRQLQGGPREEGPREEAPLWTHIRRELYSAPSLGGISSESDSEDATEDTPVTSSDGSRTDEDTGGSEKEQDWDLPKARTVVSEQRKRPRRRWSHRLGSLGSLDLMVTSMLDLRQLNTFEHKKSRSSLIHCRDRRSLSNLQISGTSDSVLPRPFCLDDNSGGPRSWLSHEVLTFPKNSESDEIRSPDSACSMGYNSREATPDSLLDVPSLISRPSLSSRFLGRGQHRYAPDSLKLPVSKVRPLMEDRRLDNTSSTSVKTERGGAQRRRSAGLLWRRSSNKTPLDTTASLHKSEHSLVSVHGVSPVLCSELRQISKRPQHLCEDPSLRIPLSYCNAKASSTTRRRGPGSVGEGSQLQTLPRSPKFSRTEGSHLNVDPAASSLQLGSVIPSRIPQPKQPLSPRRCLTRESSGFLPCAGPDPGLDSTSASGHNKPASRQRSVELLPLKPKRSPVCEGDVSWPGFCCSGSVGSLTLGVKGPEKEDVAEKRPLVDEQCAVTSADSEKEESVTVETCRQVVCELQDCVRRSVQAYSTVAGADPTEEQLQMKSLLSDAFASLKCELHSLPPPDPQGEAPPVGRGAEDKTLVLLEQYAQLLLQSVEKKMDTQT